MKRARELEVEKSVQLNTNKRNLKKARKDNIQLEKQTKLFSEDHLKLIANGKILEDPTMTMSDSKMKAGQTIFVIQKLTFTYLAFVNGTDWKDMASDRNDDEMSITNKFELESHKELFVQQTGLYFARRLAEIRQTYSVQEFDEIVVLSTIEPAFLKTAVYIAKSLSDKPCVKIIKDLKWKELLAKDLSDI